MANTCDSTQYIATTSGGMWFYATTFNATLQPFCHVISFYNTLCYNETWNNIVQIYKKIYKIKICPMPQSMAMTSPQLPLQYKWPSILDTLPISRKPKIAVQSPLSLWLQRDHDNHGWQIFPMLEHHEANAVILWPQQWQHNNPSILKSLTMASTPHTMVPRHVKGPFLLLETCNGKRESKETYCSRVFCHGVLLVPW